MKRKRKPEWVWKCTNPECWLGGVYQTTGPRTAVGIGWCIACKGGTQPATGMGKVFTDTPPASRGV